MLKYKSSVEEEDIYIILSIQIRSVVKMKFWKKMKGEGNCIFRPIIEHFLGENIITVQTMVYF